MNKKFYPVRRTFTKYNDKQILAYLSEEIVENYVPENDGDEKQPFTAYAYTGTEGDGGTLLDVDDFSRDSLINAILRARYSLTSEEAIKTHQIILMQNPDIDKKEEYEAEWAQFLKDRDEAIQTVDRWLENE